jgi:cellulose synthase/poly-beta-1,6-N-acetylglucosamine synthase-like glycosyltransferase
MESGNQKNTYKFLMSKIQVIIPAYNEEKLLQMSLMKFSKWSTATTDTQ